MLERETSPQRRREALWLAGFVLSSSLAGLLLYVSAASGLFSTVNYSIAPGFQLLAAIVCCGVYAMAWGEGVGRALGACVLFCPPMLLDLVHLRIEVFVVVGTALTTMACSYVYAMLRASLGGRVGFWIVGAYIYSTYIYNALHAGYGHMSFFGAGYTS
jgi:hypothetical protein